jgi:hypothetical protein
MIKKTVLVLMIFICFTNILFSQDREENSSKKYIYWGIMQLIPSPTFFNDGNDVNNRIRFGFKWNITPVNFSFRTNKFVSPVQFFIINPVRRFTGSAEIFVYKECGNRHRGEINITADRKRRKSCFLARRKI